MPLYQLSQNSFSGRTLSAPTLLLPGQQCEGMNARTVMLQVERVLAELWFFSAAVPAALRVEEIWSPGACKDPLGRQSRLCKSLLLGRLRREIAWRAGHHQVCMERSWGAETARESLLGCCRS